MLRCTGSCRTVRSISGQSGAITVRIDSYGLPSSTSEGCRGCVFCPRGNDSTRRILDRERSGCGSRRLDRVTRRTAVLVGHHNC